jgi:hypothetical protein
MTGFIVSVFLFRNRVSSKEAFEGLELGEGKLSRPVLRGPGGRKAAWLLGSVGCVALPVVCLVSLVSAWGRNWSYLCGGIERVETGDTVEIASIDAVCMQVAEKMVGWQMRLGEYPTTLTQT